MPVYGFLANFGARRFPKGNEGKTQGGLPLGNPVCLWQTELFKLNLKSSPSSSGYNRRRRLATRSSGKQQAERTAVRTAPIVCPEESPLVRPQAHTPCPRRGMTRRLRRELGLAVPWGVHTFLSMAKEKCAKESQRHGDSRGGPPRCASRASACGSPSGCPLPRFALLTRREKALYCPFLKEGVRNVARSMVKLTTFTFVRARAHSFPLSKRARLFPSAAYRRSASPPHGWGWNAALAGRDVTERHGRFSRGAGQRVWETASAGGASREARCRAAVKPRPSCMSPYAPRP